MYNFDPISEIKAKNTLLLCLLLNNKKKNTTITKGMSVNCGIRSNENCQMNPFFYDKNAA